MYLFVYISLLLAAMGLFTQAYLLQASHLWARQKGVAEVMFVWHSGAYTMAKELSANLGAYPCRVSPMALPTGVALCQRSLQNPTGTPVAPYSRFYLPPGYLYNTYQLEFPSVVYQSSGTTYLATYVPQESDGGTSWMGFTSGEIMKQMELTDASPLMYGQVTNQTCNGTAGYWFRTNASQNTKQICYPALASIPLGSVGYISVLY